MTKPLSPLEEMKGRYACLLFDSTMKTVLGTVQNEDLFIEILELLIPGKHIASVEMLNKEYHGLAQNEKRVIFDLLCKDRDTGEEFLVEVQNAPEDGYISRYGLLNDRNGEALTQSLNFVFLELDRLKLAKDEYDKCRTRLERFVFSFKYMHTFEEFPPSFMDDPLLRRLSQAAELASLPLEKMQQYEADMRTEIDQWAQLAYAEEKGLAEGRAEGREEIVRALLNHGMTPAQISEYTGLSAEDLAALK